MGGTNLDKPVFDFSLLYPRKNRLRRKSIVCPLDSQMKLLGIRISHSKVFSSVYATEINFKMSKN